MPLHERRSSHSVNGHVFYYCETFYPGFLCPDAHFIQIDMQIIQKMGDLHLWSAQKMPCDASDGAPWRCYHKVSGY